MTRFGLSIEPTFPTPGADTLRVMPQTPVLDINKNPININKTKIKTSDDQTNIE